MKRVHAGSPFILAAVVVSLMALWRVEPTVRTLKFPTGEGRPAIVALFTNDDCAAYAGLIGFLNRASEMGLVVHGVVVDDHGNPAAPENDGVNVVGFPVRPDLAREVTRQVVRLGYRTSPVIILVDKDARVHMALPPMQNVIAHANAMGRLVEQAQRMDREATR